MELSLRKPLIFGSILAFLKAKSKGHLAGKYGAPTGRRATDRRKKKGAKIFFLKKTFNISRFFLVFFRV